MKKLIIFALVLAVVVPFTVSAHDHICKNQCANGPVEFGQRQEWKDAPIRKDALGREVQDISGTAWYKNQMRSIARQLKELGKLHLFPMFQVWNY